MGLWITITAAVVVIPILVHARSVARRRLAAWRALVRATGDLGPGPAILRVRVAADPGTFVNLGESVESGEGASSNPDLVSREVRLVADDGTGLLLPAGASIDVRNVVGAKRRHVESETTAGGMVHRYTFEVGPGSSFLLGCVLPASPEAAFREQAVTALRPLGRKFRAGDVLPDYTFGQGLGAGALIGAFFSGLLVGLPVMGCVDADRMSAAWWFAAAGGVLCSAFGEWVSTPDPPPEA